MILGKSLFENRHPERAVLTRMSKQSFTGLLVQWQEVIDNNSMGNSKSMEVYGIDTLSIKLIFCVEENFFEFAREFSNGRCCRQKPAVTKATLTDIIGTDSVTKECFLIAIQIVCSLPLNFGALNWSLLVHVFPVQRVCVRFEVAVGVAGRGAQQGVERLKLALIPLRHKVALVTDTLCVSHNFS